MRNQWLRLLLLRSHAPTEPHIPQVHHLRSFASSLFHHRAPRMIPKRFTLIRGLSSSPELVVEPPKTLSDQGVILLDVFGKPEKSNDVIKQDLDLKSIVIDHDLVLSVLRNPDTPPDVAKRVFSWVLENYSEKLSSKSYNLMLGIFGGNGFVKEIWDMIGSMKEKGFGVSKGAYNNILQRFEKDGLSDDVEKLKDLYSSGSASRKKTDKTRENDFENLGKIHEIIQNKVWDDDTEKQLCSLGVEFTSDLVTSVLDSLEAETNKALIFFRWVQESGLFKHDQWTYNAIARVLAKEDHDQKFWKVVNEIRSEGYEMDRDTYVNISQQFFKRKMIKESVDLYEFAMLGENKPSGRDGTLLLKKIVVSKELDMDLFLRVVRAFKANGNELTDSHLDAIIKSLISVGRLTECNKILAALKEAGYQPSASSQRKIAFILSSGGKTEEVMEFMDTTVASQDISNHGTWVSLVKGHCKNRNLDEGSNSIRKMVENGGASHASHALDSLVGTYCRKNQPLDAYKFVVEMVNDKGLRPWCATYRMLTSKLLAEKHFNEALDVMRMMKSQEYPPDLDSFVEYLSRTGGAEDAVTFSQAMTSKRFPSTAVFIRLFEAYFKARRHTVAQDFLSRCPRYIKNHADILNLFSSQKTGSTRTPSAVAV